MAKGFFHTHFPPPAAMRMPVVGVDISDQSIHAIRLEPGHSGLEVEKIMRKEIDDGVVQEGKVIDLDALTKILGEFRKENKLYFVNVSLPEQHGYIFTMDIPKMRKSEVRDFIELHLEEYVPIPIADAIFDYSYVNDKNRKDDVIAISVSVYPREIVEHYLSAFYDAGYQVIRLEIEAHAIARAVVDEKDDGTVMILDLGKTRSGIFIVGGGVVQFSSTISIGGDELTGAIMKEKDIPEEKAEELKQKYGLVPSEEESDVSAVLTSVVSVLRDEIRKRYAYWNTHNALDGERRNKIEQIVLCGGNANLKGLTEYISEQIDVPVGIANVFVNVNTLDDYIPEASFEESLRYSTAIGLTLKHH